MPTIAQQLTQLDSDRDDLVTNLTTKGITGLTGDETFTELVPEVLNIPSGGGSEYNAKIDTSKNYNSNSDGGIRSIITQIGNIDTSNMTTFAYMFNSCSNLTTAPQLNTSKGTNFSNMFNGCNKLTQIPQLNTSSGTNFNNMFGACLLITTIPQLNTSSGTNFQNMFTSCNNLTTIPQLDTSSGTNFQNMFYNCKNLTTIPQLDTSNATTIYQMFYSCKNLTTIPQLDASKVTAVSVIFGSCSKLANLGGLTNLGQAYLTTRSANYSSYTLALSDSTLITHDSLMNVINNLYDIATKGCNAQKLILGSTNLAKLTAEEIAVATNKGWSVS